MIIYIDKTIFEHCGELGLNESEKLLFSDLATAHQKGNCLLCGELHSIKFLMESLEGIYKSIYRKIYIKHAQAYSIMNEVQKILVISYGGKNALPTFIRNKSEILKVEEAVQYRLSERCSLVCENLNDCRFYNLIAKRYVYAHRIKGIDISFRNELGGGNTINTVLEKCVKEDKVLTLCLADSDIKHWKTKKYPNHPARGDTANALIKTYQKLKDEIDPKTYEVFCLTVHEIENLIPLNVLFSIAKDTGLGMTDGVEYLRKLVKANHAEAILYYDLKNGANKIKSDPSITYWIEIATLIDDDSFPSFTSKLLDLALDVMEGKTSDTENFITTVHIDGYLMDLWGEIGHKVFSWGCTNQPIRA